jgi:hypothetical protein
MYRRDEFIKMLSNLNSGEYLKKQVLILEQYVDTELQKSESMLSLINSNSQGSVVNNIETISEVSETYAIHTNIDVKGDTLNKGNSPVWNEELLHTTGSASATVSPWTDISISVADFDGVIKILLPDDTNKNVAKMLADKYGDTTIQGGNPVGGHWGKDNVLVQYDVASKKMYMVFKLLPQPVSVYPKIFEAEGVASLWCNPDYDSQGNEIPPVDDNNQPIPADITINLIRWSSISYEDALSKANKAALEEAESKLNCELNSYSYTLESFMMSCSEYDSNTEGVGVSVYDITATGVTTIEAEKNAIKAAKRLAILNIQENGLCSLSEHDWQPMYMANGCFYRMKCAAHNPSEEREPSDTEWSMYFNSTSASGATCYLPQTDTLPTLSVVSASMTSPNNYQMDVQWYLEFNKYFTDPSTQIYVNISANNTSEVFVVGAGAGLTQTIKTTHFNDTNEYEVHLTIDATKPTYNVDALKSSFSVTVPKSQNCLKEGTMIKMGDGSFKLIEELNVGDVLASYDIHQLDRHGDNHEYISTWSTVEFTYMESEATLVSIKETLHSGYYVFNGVLNSTESHHHIIFDGSEYRIKSTDEVVIGDCLIKSDGSMESIDTIEFIDEHVTVYQIDTEDFDVFVAEGYITHNSKLPSQT